MANDNEEKESKGSNLVQLKISDKTKSELQELADTVGMPLNTYLYHLLIEAIERKNRL